MDISQSGAISSIVNSQQFDQVSAQVLNKALVAQASSALSLIHSLPEPQKTAPVGSLGHNIDVKA